MHTQNVTVGERIPLDVLAASVPQADPAAPIDPHWLHLRANRLLPDAYMPPTMNGTRPVWVRTIAAFLVSVFMFATAFGICLTYGPPTGW